MTRRADQDLSTPSPRLLPPLAAIGVAGCVVLAITYVVAGRTLVEKALTELVAPVGLVWLGLMMLTWLLIRYGQRFFAAIAFAAWLILTLGGNAFLSHALISQLESPWTEVDSMAMEPLDVLVLLGGGTTNRVNGDAQLGDDGQRVLTAAQLFLAGQVDQIICTGSNSFSMSENDLHPREEGRDLLLALAIPAERIHLLEGPNTSQELKMLKQWLDERAADSGKSFERVGVVTSAYHLSRAIRLAKANGIDAIGVPANFKANGVSLAPSWVVPNGGNLQQSEVAIKECIARLIGR